MYAYGIFNNKFFEFGECKFLDDRDKNRIIAANVDSNDVNYHKYWCYFELNSNVRVWQVSSTEGEVYKHRTLWLDEDDIDRAYKLFAKDFSRAYYDEVDKAEKRYRNRMLAMQKYYKESL